MQDINAMLGGVRPPEDGRKPEEQVSVPEKKPEPQPKKLTHRIRDTANRLGTEWKDKQDGGTGPNGPGE